MEFTITCPIDGPVTVSLEDIDTVVLRDSERADITFICPHCGSEITVTAVVPSFLLAAIEALAEESETPGGPFSGIVEVVDESETTDAAPLAHVIDDPVVEAYCEYFRRQLSEIECADDAIHEIDATH